ncbi:TetR/AcrR family transcriptional regulator [Nocardioides sp. GY 10113]|uniref:TetR/AcrR family transcriptional regulator n=1 Tax=Nocardioides sp. GY 10113 TaxID=2569761 RepID=UPI0010A91544|nr:TetR/AcrR family transcriptional regulator [Nocardioides sp. GY 10113]TIC86803.1 TetR/AcrR family transcriptional regulator [Nocardioides sp. GY 10113]
MAVQSGVYRGVSAAERASERRARLLEATLEVWADPRQRTTMTAVCSAAGLTERYFYESFGGLDDALRAVLDAVAAEIEQVTQAAADAAGPEPVSQATAVLEAFVRFLTDDPRKGRVAVIEAGAMPALRARRTELLRDFAHRSAVDARDRLGLPHRSPHEEEIAGLLFIGGMAELVTAWLEGALEATPEEIVATAGKSLMALYA